LSPLPQSHKLALVNNAKHLKQFLCGHSTCIIPNRITSTPGK